ncbi:MAG: maleylacetoacetate isomerase [Pseudomonadota bacterium]
MKLFGYFRSSTTYRVRIGLNLKGLDYSVAPVNLLEGDHTGFDYTRLNAFQTVPALRIGDRTYVQSMAILAALDDLYPEPPLLPVANDARQVCRELSFSIATEIHAPNNVPVLTYLKREFAAQQDDIKAWYATWVHKTFAPIEARLAAWKAPSEFPFGDQPGLFEAVLIPQIFNARRFEVDMSAYPRLVQIDQQCRTRPAFEKAHPDIQPDSPKA